MAIHTGTLTALARLTTVYNDVDWLGVMDDSRGPNFSAYASSKTSAPACFFLEMRT
jgi:hypothetical protein